jgi:hypothetical protein
LIRSTTLVDVAQESTPNRQPARRFFSEGFGVRVTESSLSDNCLASAVFQDRFALVARYDIQEDSIIEAVNPAKKGVEKLKSIFLFSKVTAANSIHI